METEQRKLKNGKKKRLAFSIGVLLAVLICAAVVGAILLVNRQTAMKLKTTYLTIQYPKEYKDYLVYEETMDGQDSEIVFFMNHAKKKIELFRVAVCSKEPESYYGVLNTDNGMMYVSLIGFGADRTVFVVEDQAETDEVDVEMEALYYAMMEGMSTVSSSIEQNPNFSFVKGVFGNAKKDANLSHWKLTLPENITWEELNDDGVYRAVFYGAVGENKVKLYTISLGDTAAEAPIGKIAINGENKLVSVEIHDLNANGALTEEEKAAGYVLMDTVNDVLQAIRQDKSFSDQLEPVVKSNQ